MIKTSQLISILEEELKTNGDLRVVFEAEYEYISFHTAVTGEVNTINVATREKGESVKREQILVLNTTYLTNKKNDNSETVHTR